MPCVTRVHLSICKPHLPKPRASILQPGSSHVLVRSRFSAQNETSFEYSSSLSPKQFFLIPSYILRWLLVRCSLLMYDRLRIFTRRRSLAQAGPRPVRKCPSSLSRLAPSFEMDLTDMPTAANQMAEYHLPTRGELSSKVSLLLSITYIVSLSRSKHYLLPIPIFPLIDYSYLCRVCNISGRDSTATLLPSVSG